MRTVEVFADVLCPFTHVVARKQGTEALVESAFR
jgi:hypothetical protein